MQCMFLLRNDVTNYWICKWLFAEDNLQEKTNGKFKWTKKTEKGGDRERQQVWYYSTRQTVLLNDFLQERAQKKLYQDTY